MGTPCTLPRTVGATFASDVLEATGPVLLVIPAGSCSSCRVALAAAPDPARFRCFCLDESGAGDVATVLAVAHRPTVLIFRDGKVIRRLIGEPLPDVVDTILRTETAHAGRHS